MTNIISFGASYYQITGLHFPFDKGLMPHTEVVGDEYEVSVGGSAMIFAQVCRALDLPSTFIGKVGTDIFGQQTINMVKSGGITPDFIQDPFVKTNLAINFVDSKGDSVMTVIGTANQSLDFKDIQGKLENILDDVDILYIGGLFKLKKVMGFLPDIISLAQEYNTKIVLDHGRVHNALTPEHTAMIQACIGDISYYLPSHDEFLAVWNTKTIEEGLKKVSKLTQATIVVKDGEQGAYTITNREVIHIPAYSVSVKNTVGAGDTFNAGFIKAQTLGMNLSESITFGQATAALKISTTPLPSYEEVIDFMKLGKNSLT